MGKPETGSQLGYKPSPSGNLQAMNSKEQGILGFYFFRRIPAKLRQPLCAWRNFADSFFFLDKALTDL